MLFELMEDGFEFIVEYLTKQNGSERVFITHVHE